MSEFLRIQSISQLHQMLGYEKPRHPMITVIDYAKVRAKALYYDVKIVTDFYIISLKSPAPTSLQYGRQYYDFAEGTMMCMAPGQVFSVSDFNEQISYEGWGLFFHPDLIIHSPLGNKIKAYNFFHYAANEALHLSEQEKQLLNAVISTIAYEYNQHLDRHSQQVITTAIEQLLNYTDRFYSRQFLTRKKENSDLITRFESLIHDYFSSGLLSEKGLPQVDYFAGRLHLSPGYLSDLLKKETGKTAKEYLQDELLERAKYRLLNSSDTVNEVAYSLGFEYPQYFNRLFKAKTGMTPLEYRKLN